MTPDNQQFAIDITATGWSLANARAAAQWAKLAYSSATITGAKTNTQVLIAELDNYIVVGFRGTKEPHDFLTDAECWREKVVGGQIHAGFLTAINDVIAQIHDYLLKLPQKPLVIVGHSLGGALAHIYADMLVGSPFAVHSVYTIGSPRWCNGQYAAEYNAVLGDRTFRIANEDDPVPMVPGLLMGYRGVGTFVFLTRLIGQQIAPSLWSVAIINAAGAYIGWRRGRINMLCNHDKDVYITKLNNLTA